MTRAEIAEKFKYVKKEEIVNPQTGECYEMNTMTIEEQLKGLGDGKRKIFFFKIDKADYNGEVPSINLQFVSEDVYISPTKYV